MVQKLKCSVTSCKFNTVKDNQCTADEVHVSTDMAGERNAGRFELETATNLGELTRANTSSHTQCVSFAPREEVKKK
jgi:hypothetical protein